MDQASSKHFDRNSLCWVSIFEKCLILNIKVMEMRNLVRFHQNICIFEDFTAIYFFCVLLRIWRLKKFKQFLDIKLPWKILKHAWLNSIKTHKTTFNNSTAICSDNKFWKCRAILSLLVQIWLRSSFL